MARGRIELYLDCEDTDPPMLAREILAAGMESQTVLFDQPERLLRVRQFSQGRVAIMPKWQQPRGTAKWL